MNVNIFRVIVPVNDIEKAKEFYSRLFGHEGERVSPGRHYFKSGSVILACFDSKADGDYDFAKDANPEYIYFDTDDLEQLFANAKASGCSYLEDKIEERPWGERSFYAKDPFGNPLCFVDRNSMFTGH